MEIAPAKLGDVPKVDDLRVELLSGADRCLIVLYRYGKRPDVTIEKQFNRSNTRARSE